VNDVAGLANHPQLAARARWMEVESPVGRIPALRPAHNIQGADPPEGGVPALGEHTREILEELANEEEQCR
jgi:crotonobetainyl-CoA:carnitine CoA-transferase CaiB-like acyl-CoA transferase